MDVLSFDLAENILSSIDSPGDLRTLALTSQFWAELIVPRHIQYRRLNIGAEDHLPLWSHLAKRKDLTRNIREVSMTNLRRRGEQCPTTLVPLLAGDPEDGGESNFLQAFRNMERLESFTWKSHKCPSFMDPHQNLEFFDILSKTKCLIKLDLSSMLNLQAPTNKTFYKSYQVSNFKNLTCLDLSGRFWLWYDDDSALTSMLLQCPDLEELSMFCTQHATPYEMCHFPRLRRLTICNTERSMQNIVVKFIYDHTTIQELSWHPFDTRLLPGSLPALQKILSSHLVVMNILQDEILPHRALTRIGRIHLNPPAMSVLEQIDGSQVRELFLCACADAASIRRISTSFPNVTTLGVLDEIYFRMYNEGSIDDEIFTLSHFPALECILTAHIWKMISDLEEWEARQDAIMKLARACPRLKTIVPSSRPRRKISLTRDGDRITWMEVYPHD